MSVIFFFVDQNQKNKPLTEILDIKKLMNVDRTIESANGLPNECYTSVQYLEYERDKIFCDKWTVIGVGSSCLLYTSPSPRDRTRSRMPSSA